MGYITANSGQKRPQPSAGSHEAMLVQVIDLGTQPGSSAYPDPKRKIELMFELLDEKGEFDGKEKPFAVWQYASPYISYDKNKTTNYHKLINQLFGSKTHEEAQSVDFNDILGTVYMVQLVDNNGFTNIESLTKGTAKMQEEYKNYKTFNNKLFFTLEDFDINIFESLSEKKQEKIKTSPEYQNKDLGDTVKNEEIEDLPFN